MVISYTVFTLTDYVAQSRKLKLFLRTLRYPPDIIMSVLHIYLITEFLPKTCYLQTFPVYHMKTTIQKNINEIWYDDSEKY